MLDRKNSPKSKRRGLEHSGAFDLLQQQVDESEHEHQCDRESKLAQYTERKRHEELSYLSLHGARSWRQVAPRAKIRLLPRVFCEKTLCRYTIQISSCSLRPRRLSHAYLRPFTSAGPAQAHRASLRRGFASMPCWYFRRVRTTDWLSPHRAG